jgi:hypothetical protein
MGGWMNKRGGIGALCYTLFRRARTVTAVTFVVAFGALQACGSDGLTGPHGEKLPKNFLGSYDASKINDKALPVAIFSEPDYTYERMSATIIIALDGTYSAKMTSRQTIAGKVDTFIDSTGGTWALDGKQLTFTDGADASVDHADWSEAGTLTFVEPEGPAMNTYVYTRKP